MSSYCQPKKDKKSATPANIKKSNHNGRERTTRQSNLRYFPFINEKNLNNGAKYLDRLYNLHFSFILNIFFPISKYFLHN